MIEAATQRPTPVAVSAFGDTRVRARLVIDCEARRRAPLVYPALRAAARFTPLTVPPWSPGSPAPGTALAGSPVPEPAGDRPIVHEGRGETGDEDAGDDVEQEMVARRHHAEPHPG